MTVIRIAPMTAAHWPAVERIHRAGIATGHATFEAAPPTWAEFDADKRPDLRVVALRDDVVVAWAAAGSLSGRPVYAGVVEHSVYVDPDAQGRRIGRTTLAALLDAGDEAGVWTVQSGIFPENVASLRLHENAGFRVIGTRERVGLMTFGPLAGRWRDVVLMERRSASVGSD